MAAKHSQTHAKRARELALRERRERKRAKKAQAAAERAAAAPTGESSQLTSPAAGEERDVHSVIDSAAAGAEMAAGSDPVADVEA